MPSGVAQEVSVMGGPSQRERSESFLLALSDRLRRLEDPLAILEEAAAALGSHLEVSRAGYAEVEADGNTFVIERDWTDGTLKPGAGRRTIASFGEQVVAMLYRGETQRIEDARSDPRVRVEDQAAFKEMSIVAAVTVPLVKDDRLVAMFSLQKSSPRHWSHEEVQLIEEVAERTWAAHERARTAARLRDSEAMLAFLLTLSDRTRSEADAGVILAITAEMLGTHLKLARVTYGEVDAEAATLTVSHAWGEDVPDAGGTYPLSTFGETVMSYHYAGQTFVTENAAVDPRIEPEGRAFAADMRCGAAVTVPLSKGGMMTSLLSVQDSNPRRWRDWEVRLLEEVAERTWGALQSAGAEARLKESEAQLRLLADNMAQLAWIADGKGAVYWYNKRWYEYSGAAPERMAGDAWAEFIHPDDLAGAQQKIFEALERGEAFELVLRFRGHDGSYRPFLTRVQPERSPAGEVVRWFGTNTDISEQLEAERASAFLLSLADRTRQLGNPHEVLAAGNELLGVHLGSNRVGYAEVDVMDPDVVEVLHTWTDGRVQSVEGRHHFPDFGAQNVALLRSGQAYVLDDAADPLKLSLEDQPAYAAMEIGAAISVPLMKGGRLVAVLYVHQIRPRDWTDTDVQLVREVAERTWATLQHARAEERLRESDALLAAFMANAPVGMYLKDEQGRYVLANAGMERIFGRPPQEALGRTATELFGEALDQKILDQDAVALMEGRAQVAEQHSPGTEDGSWTMVIRFPVDLGAQGKRIGGFAIDITEQKQAEAELARSREALYQSEKLTALGSLLAGVSHELNNPLSVVVGQSTMLEEDAEGSLYAARAAKIRTAAERCARIVQAFLAMARQKPPERTRVDVNAVIKAALELTDYGARTAGIIVERDLAPGLPLLDGDADQLHQVLANLFVNAQQALQDQPGERRLRVVSRPGAEPGMIELEIADSGPGVSPEFRRRVFEPFFTTKPAGVGTGLGLSFSLGVVEAHGGTLELLEPEKGAAFRLTLPAAPGQIENSNERQGGDPRAQAGRGHALVVDDEPEIADMLAELLEGAGYRVRIADSGVTAQRQLAVRDFDLILSDLRMPDLDGPGLHAWIRANRPNLLSRIGFVTGDTLGPSAASFLASTDRPCLEKPFTAKALRRFVEQVAGSASSEAA
jgi:PAS domain S-box-containing protein